MRDPREHIVESPSPSRRQRFYSIEPGRCISPEPSSEGESHTLWAAQVAENGRAVSCPSR